MRRDIYDTFRYRGYYVFLGAIERFIGYNGGNCQRQPYSHDYLYGNRDDERLQQYRDRKSNGEQYTGDNSRRAHRYLFWRVHGA